VSFASVNLCVASQRMFVVVVVVVVVDFVIDSVLKLLDTSSYFTNFIIPKSGHENPNHSERITNLTAI
jgi:hypothetical protein